MFLNDFFKIVNQNSTSETITSEIELNANHKIFDGHFPGFPVTPGVLQLQMVKEILEQHLKKKMVTKAMRTCKFLKILNPMETPLLFIDLKFVQDNFLNVTASATNGDEVYFKAQISYQ